MLPRAARKLDSKAASEKPGRTSTQAVRIKARMCPVKAFECVNEALLGGVAVQQAAVALDRFYRAPPRPKAITGLPLARASTMVMPKSSSPGVSDRKADRAYKLPQFAGQGPGHRIPRSCAQPQLPEAEHLPGPVSHDPQFPATPSREGAGRA